MRAPDEDRVEVGQLNLHGLPTAYYAPHARIRDVFAVVAALRQWRYVPWFWHSSHRGETALLRINAYSKHGHATDSPQVVRGPARDKVGNLGLGSARTFLSYRGS